ncbi:hypothetical protein C162_20431 [Paenibacillus sp. FSL R7-269]|uniref:hypothetical protein n=1 Tax=Paenibacillus sp. FSL R7-269 TaxID=1226755 RepID=UPI0003E22354|nr:hypothetical protein [Paenibacillus sp. FSL R7-269]ETT45738.1 hypothetical protein C162_20431 [Paenibacillus sp. FSL R7-269]
MTKSTRKPIDPFFQRRNYFTVWDDGGKLAGTVFVLDTSMMPQNQRGGRLNEQVLRVRREMSTAKGKKDQI